MIILVEGDVGSGKSLLCVILAATLKKYKHVYANFTIRLKKWRMFKLEEFFAGQYANSLIIVDEAYSLADSRKSQSRSNLDITAATFQSRKMKCDLIYVSQLFSVFDVRLRELCSALISCEFDEEANTFFYTIFLKKRVNEHVLFARRKKIALSYQTAEKFFNLYDTYEIIQTNEQKNLTMTKKEIDELIQEVREEMLSRNIKKSKDFVKYYLRKKNIVFTQIIDEVYYNL